MKTKSTLLFAASLVFSTFSFSQEITENLPKIISLSDYDYQLEKAQYSTLSDRQASFSKTINYKSLNEFINFHIQFPDDARLTGISGSVIARFKILGDGSLGEIYFVQSPDPILSKEVERVLRMAPNFAPAILDGRIISSFEQVKIHFSLH